MQYDVIILGAGPAGLTAANAAASCGKRTLILDKAEKPGIKLLLAGGGKGNVTNTRVSAADYLGEDPAFAEPALERRTPDMVCRWLTDAGIPLEERDHGRIFCKTSAKDVLRLLFSTLPKDRCRLQDNAAVTAVSAIPGQFTVHCGDETHTAPRLIAATGSPAWPQCGADDSGLRLLRALGHRIVPPRPVLCPFIMPPSWPLADLAGISLPVTIACDVPGSPAFTDALLFTHKGISGPAALQISCYWRKNAAVTINFLPETDLTALLDEARGKATPQSLLGKNLPDRLLAALLPPQTASRRVSELSRKDRTAIAQSIQAHTITPLRTEGLAKAEAAAGGVATRDVDPFTLESRIVPGLFFCGEVLDITGNLGGYNLHWAWASGMVAGESAALNL